MANIKEVIKHEWLRCAKDPVHFMKKYCNIQHPQRGRILFNLYPFQEKVLKLIHENDYAIVNKSRQLGLTTLAAGYALWLMTFHRDRNILCIATKQDTAKNIVTKVSFMYENLPSWLKEKTEENNKLTLRLRNGSQIKATSASSDAGRSEAVSMLIIDEAAFIDGIEEIWASAQQTLSTGGRALVLSTPYGTGNWFHRMWVRAVENEEGNQFLPIRLPWHVHPERDQAWRDRQDELLGDPRIAAQECDTDFNTSGDTVFYSEQLDFIEQTTLQEPVEMRGPHKDLWIWESPDYSREYMVVADVGRGDGRDFSGAHVMDIETNTQVAEYKGKLSPKEFGYFLVGLATEYNEAILVVENANIGWATLDAIEGRGYKNLYYSPKSQRMTAESYIRHYEGNAEMVPGFTMSQRTRPLVINKFREMLSDNSVTIRSRRLWGEMKVFIWRNGRAEAQSGYNDDLVMPMSIGQFLRETSLKFQQDSIDRAKAALQAVKSNKPPTGGYSSNRTSNPYNVNIGGREENIEWLL